MTDEKKSKVESKNKTKDEIEIENKDLLNVFFDNSGSQFESQFFLSRKRMLNAENGQNELSDLLKSKLKALDMMLLILTNNKSILKESDLSCCEVLNNLLSVSKKDKAYGEHIYSKIKTIMIYLIKNKISLEEKNVEGNKVVLKFLLTLHNIKFDNGYFKQTLDLIANDNDLAEIFINELFDKLFKGRNITIKIKEMKYIIKTILTNEKIMKNKNYFDIMELMLNYAKEKQNGGCRTSFQLNQVVYLLQYMTEIININEIKKFLPDKNEQKKRLIKIIEIFLNSINDLINKEDYEFDKNINKKILEIKNENIKRKKNFFSEMLNFLNKLKKNFEVIKEKEFNQKLEEINNLYKNVINTKYVVLINSNINNNNKKIEDKKNLGNKPEKIKNEIKDGNEDDNNNDNEESEEEEDKDKNAEENKIDEEINNKEDELKEKKGKINKQNEKEEIELEEENEEQEQEIKKEKNKKKKKEKKIKKDDKENEGEQNKLINKKTKRKESKNKEENKNEKKKKKK